jgi:hypothetical protein
MQKEEARPEVMAERQNNPAADNGRQHKQRDNHRPCSLVARQPGGENG